MYKFALLVQMFELHSPYKYTKSVFKYKTRENTDKGKAGITEN